MTFVISTLFYIDIEDLSSVITVSTTSCRLIGRLVYEIKLVFVFSKVMYQYNTGVYLYKGSNKLIGIIY